MGSAYTKDGKVTRTQETVYMYRLRVNTMIKAAIKDGYSADFISIKSVDLSRWLIAHKSIYVASTYRQYSAALMMWLEECNHPDHADALALLNSVSDVPHLKRSLSSRTSSTKDKKLSDGDRDSIIYWLKNHHTRYSVALTILLRVGGAVGLRPCEWKSARVVSNEDGVSELQVINAKATNGRSNGDVRTLLLDELSVGMVDVIEQSTNNFAKLDKLGEWKRLYNGCRKTLYRACRTLWPNRKKYPTLYSLRHQFCADAKSAGLSKIEVAALMGHASSETAGEHYGKRRVGRGSCAVKPSSEDVTRLEIKDDAFSFIKLS